MRSDFRWFIVVQLSPDCLKTELRLFYVVIDTHELELQLVHYLGHNLK